MTKPTIPWASPRASSLLAATCARPPWAAVTPSNRAGHHRAARHCRRWADPAGRRHRTARPAFSGPRIAAKVVRTVPGRQSFSPRLPLAGDSPAKGRAGGGLARVVQPADERPRPTYAGTAEPANAGHAKGYHRPSGATVAPYALGLGSVGRAVTLAAHRTVIERIRNWIDAMRAKYRRRSRRSMTVLRLAYGK